MPTWLLTPNWLETERVAAEKMLDPKVAVNVSKASTAAVWSLFRSGSFLSRIELHIASFIKLTSSETAN